MRKKTLFSNKRGIGIVIFGLFFIILLLVMGIFYVVFDPIADRVYDMADDRIEDANASAIITNAAAKTNNWWDSAFLFLFGTMWIGGLLIGYYSEDFGVLVLILMIVCLTIMLFAAGALTEFWERVTDGDNVATSTEYPYTYFILNNFIITTLVVLGSSVVILVMRNR